MDYLQKLIIDIELHSTEGVKECPTATNVERHQIYRI